MKSLPSPGSGPAWHSKLVRDLAFIKKHLRYPISRFTIYPAAMAATAFLYPLWIFLVIYSAPVKGRGSVLMPIGIVSLVTAIAMVTAVRFLTTLRFFEVRTPFFSAENQAFLVRFLQAQQLAVFRHPEAPEVFQILSKNINPSKEEREVIIFIADDKRILINSHFTGSELKARIGHHKEMARILKEWLDAHTNASAPGIVHRTV